MGISDDFGIAFAKSQMAAGNSLPLEGTVFVSVKEDDHKRAVGISQKLHEMGFKILSTKGTCKILNGKGIPAEGVLKITEGRPNIVDTIINGEVDLIINTTVGKQSIQDSFSIRRSALDHQIPYVTTIRGAGAVTKAIEAMKQKKVGVKPVQQYYK
jgi:carbamoyl-phosphate synthase large subunit